MEHKTGTFKNDDGIDIHYRCWLPKVEVKAVLLIVHGIAEHCGRYMNLVNHFVPRGYAVYGHDHQGHGKSGGDRLMVRTFDDFTSALAIFHTMVSGWHRDKPVFLFGNSMGGLIAAHYLLEHQSAFKGAIISSPAFKSNLPGLTILMGRTMGRIMSKLTPKAGFIKLDPSGISRDQNIVMDYVSDPLVYHGKVPIRLATELDGSMTSILKSASRITLPIIILQAGDDSLVNPEGAQMFYDKAGSEDKTLKIYKGFYHEVFNEPEKERVFEDLEKWLDRHLEAEKDRVQTGDKNHKTVKRKVPGTRIKPNK
jgi:acylglycerol lipase